MNKKIALMTMAGVLAAGPAFGSGYRIPEQSLNSMALSSAYVAHTDGADTSFYNPANMAWLDNGWHSEATLTYIDLSRISYTDNRGAAYNGDSKAEQFLLPQVHLVSPAYNKFRFGLSVDYPYGLSKEWEQAFPKTFAKEFTLKVYEINPTVSYKISDKISVGFGARILHSTGKVKSDGVVQPPATTAARDMDGDTTEYGYNLAVSLRPTENLSLAATYRSKVNLELDGDAKLSLNGTELYNGYAEVMAPAPAVLTLGASYTINQTTVELVYDKTYWSAYDKLDFNYSVSLSTINPSLAALFDNPIQKNWTNTDAYRIGVTHVLNNQWTLMAGFAIDKNPVPDSTLGFELPGSDAMLYSLGARYRYNNNLQIGCSYLYDHKESRDVTNSKIDGKFEGENAHLVSLGLQYTF